MQFGITVLHASDFHGTKRQFAGWTIEKKLAFVSELYALVRKRCLIGISVSIDKEGYRTAGERTGLNKNISAYGMCFNIIVESIHNAPEIASFANQGVSFRVERGNKNDADVEQRFEYFAAHPELIGILDTMKFVDKEHSKAIQLADFLAYYSRRHAEKCEREQNARAGYDEPLATMCRLFAPHRGVLANDFFGKSD